MNPDSLIKDFDQISEAPDAVPRLRRFILDLAVRGKLVEQDPKDEPASALLKRIEAEKRRLIKKGGIRNPKTKALEEEQIAFLIPSSWSWTQLEQIGIINPRNDVDGNAEVSFVPMSMIFAEYGKPSQHEVRPWAEIKSGFTHFAEGDVGLAKITPCFENRKSTVFRNLTGGIGAGTTELHIVRPILVIADYILVFLKSSHFIETGMQKMTGTAGQKRVPRDYFAFSPFPLPPLPEQHRIVAKVDELMALCDELEAAQAKRERRRDRLLAASLHSLNNGASGDELRQNAGIYLNHIPRLITRPEHIHQLRRTILNLAVRGKLVAQDPSDEPACEMLARIRHIKKLSLRNGRAVDNPGAFEINERMDIPDGWKAVPFQEILLTLQTGPFGSSLHQQDYEEGGTPVVNPASIQNERIVPIPKMALGQEVLKRLATFKLRKGDVVMGRRGEMGRCAVVTEREAGWVCGTGSLILRFTGDISPWFVVKLIGAPKTRNYLGGASVGSTMQNLNQSILREMPVLLPPLAEQHRIVAKVDELMALCDELEARLNNTTTARRQLLEAALHEALYGQHEINQVAPHAR